MKSRFPVCGTTAIAFVSLTMAASAQPQREPDKIVLNDGRAVSGLILKNTATEVVIQERYGERTYPKSEITRILDEPNEGIEHTAAMRPGDLPDWRVIANDLRTHDTVKSMNEVPAVQVDVGVFRNIPYKSFRVNKDMEFNIYGDPADPSAMEFGLYGRQANDTKLKSFLRAYLAGFLSSREEVAALYDLDLQGGTRRVGRLTVETTPPDAEDAFGAWWISLYHHDDLENLRLSGSEYAALTRPAEEVLGRDGRVAETGWDAEDIELASERGDDVIIRGFFRDKNGVFRVLGSRESSDR
jgi:hypothetical protein